MMDSKSTPVIYSYGPEARDACWTELRKSLSQLASFQQHESSYANSNSEDATVINCKVTPPLPLESPIKFPPPVIRRSEHECRNMFTSLTTDKNKDVLLELRSTTSDAEEMQSCVGNNGIVTVKPSSGYDEKKDYNRCTSSSPLGLGSEKDDHSAVMSVMTPSNIVKRSLIIEHCRRRKLFMDSPPPIAINYSLLSAKNDTTSDASMTEKNDINEDNNIHSPRLSLLQILPDCGFKNDCFINASNNKFVEVDNFIEHYCKLYLGMFLITVLLRAVFY